MKWSDKEQVAQAVLQSTSIADLLRRVGLSTVGANYKTAKKWLLSHKIDTSHFEDPTKQVRTFNTQRQHDSKSVLVKDSSITQAVLRRIIIRENILNYSCSSCGNEGMWNGNALTLQLDHINGINGDNRVENLRWLCPNCHSQTDTFAGKNK